MAIIERVARLEKRVEQLFDETPTTVSGAPFVSPGARERMQKQFESIDVEKEYGYFRAAAVRTGREYDRPERVFWAWCKRAEDRGTKGVSGVARENRARVSAALARSKRGEGGT